MDFQINKMIIVSHRDFSPLVCSQFIARFAAFIMLAITVTGFSLAAQREDAMKIALPADALLGFVEDMTLPHEAIPAGLPKSYDWAKYPKVSQGNHPGSEFHAITGWAQIYPIKDTQNTSGSKVAIRDFRTYLLSKHTGQWVMIQSGRVHGRLYRADYSNNENFEANYRVNGDGVVTVNVPTGTTFHFWPSSGRSTIDPSDIAAVLVVMQARVEKFERLGMSHANSPSFLLGAGADYWLDQKSLWNHFRSNQGVAIGRLKQVTNQWQWFGMTTATSDQICKLGVCEE